MVVGLASQIFGLVIGFVCVLLVRILILIGLRSAFYSAFYRRNAAVANIWFLFLEVWNVGLAVGFVAARAIKIIMIAVFFLARIDTPILAPGVGHIGPVELDGFNTAFRKDMLLHESHRHPLIERFGLLCLLKLRHGSAFATRAGSAWRLLYVMTLMPWLRKYRVSNGSMTDQEEHILALNEELDSESDATERAAIQQKLRTAQERMAAFADGASSEPVAENELKHQINVLRTLNEKLKGKNRELKQRLETMANRASP